MAAMAPLPQHNRTNGGCVCTTEPSNKHVVQILLETPRGNTAAVNVPIDLFLQNNCFQELIIHLTRAARVRDLLGGTVDDEEAATVIISKQDAKYLMLLHNGRIIDTTTNLLELLGQQIRRGGGFIVSFQLKCRVLGGMDRQNRVGSKFGGGGVSSAQQSERERKERLKRLALESIDLAKDPYLMRNHLGTYECKLCLTLHTNEANYLSHTQGKKHQQGLAKRAYMEKLKQEKEQQQAICTPVNQQSSHYQPKPKKIRIGRPAYQVFKSRDADTNQRCLSFELQYPEIEENLQPRHRFMSAFEQRVESPPDRRFQYLLFAADPYDTVAFKIPNEPIDKSSSERFVTHWDADDKKFTLTLYFLEPEQQQAQGDTAAGTEEDQHQYSAMGAFGSNPLHMAR